MKRYLNSTDHPPAGYVQVPTASIFHGQIILVILSAVALIIMYFGLTIRCHFRQRDVRSQECEVVWSMDSWVSNIVVRAQVVHVVPIVQGEPQQLLYNTSSTMDSNMQQLIRRRTRLTANPGQTEQRTSTISSLPDLMQSDKPISEQAGPIVCDQITKSIAPLPSAGYHDDSNCKHAEEQDASVTENSWLAVYGYKHHDPYPEDESASSFNSAFHESTSSLISPSDDKYTGSVYAASDDGTIKSLHNLLDDEPTASPHGLLDGAFISSVDTSTHFPSVCVSTQSASWFLAAITRGLSGLYHSPPFKVWLGRGPGEESSLDDGGYPAPDFSFHHYVPSDTLLNLAATNISGDTFTQLTDFVADKVQGENRGFIAFDLSNRNNGLDVFCRKFKYTDGTLSPFPYPEVCHQRYHLKKDILHELDSSQDILSIKVFIYSPLIKEPISETYRDSVRLYPIDPEHLYGPPDPTVVVLLGCDEGALSELCTLLDVGPSFWDPLVFRYLSINRPRDREHVGGIPRDAATARFPQPNPATTITALPSTLKEVSATHTIMSENLKLAKQTSKRTRVLSVFGGRKARAAARAAQ